MHRIFSAQRARSGPIKVVSITEPGSSTTGSPLALAPGTHNLHVTVGTAYLAIASVADRSTDETFGLRVADPGRRLNHALDCHSGGGWPTDVETGCHTPYGP